jgi:acetyl-CoA carboxylase biotin carboxyl carrier protein
MSAPSPFTNEEVEQILRVVDRLSDVEVWFESGDLKLHVRKSSVAGVPATEIRRVEPPSESARAAPNAPAVSQQPAANRPPAVKELQVPSGAVAIRAPMLGTFYRGPSPADPPFVEVGTRVRKDDPVCLIEVMKLFNTVNAGVNGTILSVVAENAAMVEQDDILFVVQPD